MAHSTPPAAERGIPLFGGLLLTILAAASTYGVIIAVAALKATVARTGLEEGLGLVTRDLTTLTLAQLCGMGSALFVGLRMFDPDVSLREAVTAEPTRVRTLALCFLAGLCLQFPLAELANTLHGHVFGPDPLERQLALQQLLEARNMREGALVVLYIVALVPAMEEAFFRGFLLFGLERRYGAGFALLVSSSLFGVMHLGAVPAVYATVAGLVLGSLALWTRSVFPGFALHAAVNAVPVLLPERVLPIRGLNVPTTDPVHLAPWLVWVPLAAAVLLLAWVRRIEYAHES
jgi:membrane protease YdiL (CAAX protease family)